MPWVEQGFSTLDYRPLECRFFAQKKFDDEKDLRWNKLDSGIVTRVWRSRIRDFLAA